MAADMVVLRPEADWQSKKSVISCNRHMWEHQIACDVTFVVGPELERIPAHKYVLISRSSVFFSMFAGPLSGNTGNEVHIPDLEVDAFISMLRFLYVDEALVDDNNVLAVLSAANKYNVTSLSDRCLVFLKRSLRTGDVALILECAHRYEDENLQAKCKKVISENPALFLESESLPELCTRCFASIIKDDSFSVNEDQVFKAVLRYADEQCEKQQKEKTPENRREVLGELTQYVRYPLLSEEFFADEVEPSGILTGPKTVAMLKYFLKKRAGTNVPCPDGFNCKERKRTYILERFDMIASGWGFKRDNSDAISFTCSKDIMLTGVHVYGSCQGPGLLKAKYRLVQEPYGAPVLSGNVEIETDGIQKTYAIPFNTPKRLNKDKTYSMVMTFNGQITTFYGSSGLTIVESETDGVKFTFSKCKKSTNNTTPERGQIPAFIYEVVEETVPQQETMETS